MKAALFTRLGCAGRGRRHAVARRRCTKLRSVDGEGVPLTPALSPGRGGFCSVSLLPEIVRQLALEFREVARDHRDVELAQDRLLGLAVEQETEGRREAGFGAVAAA